VNERFMRSFRNRADPGSVQAVGGVERLGDHTWTGMRTGSCWRTQLELTSERTPSAWTCALPSSDRRLAIHVTSRIELAVDLGLTPEAHYRCLAALPSDGTLRVKGRLLASNLNRLRTQQCIQGQDSRQEPPSQSRGVPVTAGNPEPTSNRHMTVPAAGTQRGISNRPTGSLRRPLRINRAPFTTARTAKTASSSSTEAEAKSAILPNIPRGSRSAISIMVARCGVRERWCKLPSARGKSPCYAMP
jgi:hypothetical protein